MFRGCWLWHWSLPTCAGYLHFRYFDSDKIKVKLLSTSACIGLSWKAELQFRTKAGKTLEKLDLQLERPGIERNAFHKGFSWQRLGH